MPIRKKGDIEIKTSPKGAQVKQTGYTFYSYDKNSAALYFNFREENGEPTDLANATIRLVFVLNDEKITPKTDDIEIWLAVPGTARYIIPESMLGREGKVTGYVYLEFSDGSHTDEGRFTFEIKQSMITDMLPEAGEQYVKDFEDIKADVQSTADKATSDIKSRVDAVENAKNSTVGDIEKAKDDAESQIGDYVGEVESAKDSTIEDIDKALPEVEGKLQDLQKEMIVGGRNYIRNSNLWASKGHAPMEIMRNKLTTGTYVFSVDIEIENADKKGTQGRLGAEAKVYLEDGSYQYISCWYRPEQGESFKGRISSMIEFASKPKQLGASYVQAGLVNGDVVRAGLPKLERGNVASDWSPAIEDYDAKIKNLEKAITNLGGSI